MSSRFSPYVLKALVDTITGGAGNDATPPIGIYRSGPKIEQFFLECGLSLRIGASSRVPATTEFLHTTTAYGDGDEHIKRIILHVCDPRAYLADPDRKSTRLNSSHSDLSRMPSSA